MAERTIKGLVVRANDATNSESPLADVPVMLVRLKGRREPSVDLTDKSGSFEFQVQDEAKFAVYFPATHHDGKAIWELQTPSVIPESANGTALKATYGSRIAAAATAESDLFGRIAGEAARPQSELNAAVARVALRAVTSGLVPNTPSADAYLVAAVDERARTTIATDLGATVTTVKTSVEDTAVAAVEDAISNSTTDLHDKVVDLVRSTGQSFNVVEPMRAN